MSKNIKEIIDSGTLELYVLGQLNATETAEIDQLKKENTLIEQEIYDISMSLEKYGKLMAINAPAGVENKIFENLPPKLPRAKADDQSNESGSSNGFKMMNWILLAGTLLSSFLYFNELSNNKKILADNARELAACDSITKVQQNQYAILQTINHPDNEIVKLAASEKFAGIDLYLHSNNKTKKNVIQIIKAPVIEKGQVMQLWALKEGIAPQPMEIFSDAQNFVDVSYEDDAATYAITIEPAGGSQSPTMSNLLGTMSVEL